MYRMGLVRDTIEPHSVSFGGSRTGLLVVLLSALALVLTIVTYAFPTYAGGDLAQTGEVAIGVSGETVPGKLPRSHMTPVTLRVGFTSGTPSTPTTPELTAIRLEVSRDITFQTVGLPSCPISELYSESSDAAQVCAGSLVGSGSVVSEVTIPGKAPVTIEGRLSAFYDLGEGQPRILAQITSAGTLPLTYVIPFTIEKTHGDYGTALYVNQMRVIAGICAPKHSNCFSQTYTYNGIYGHISKFELTLDRHFIHRGRQTSLLSADCPASRRSSSAVFPLVRVQLAYPYPDATSRSQVATRRCEVSAPRHLHRTRS